MFAFKVLVFALVLSAPVFAQWSSGDESPSSRSADVEASGSEVSVTRRNADESSGIYESPEVYRRSVEGSAESDEVSSRSSKLGSGDFSDVARRSVEASGQDESPSSRSADVEASGSEVTVTRRDVEASGLDGMISSRSTEASGEEESVIARRSADTEESGSGDSPSLSCTCAMVEKIDAVAFENKSASQGSSVSRRSVEGSGVDEGSEVPTSRSDDAQPVAAASVRRVVMCKCKDADGGSGSGEINLDVLPPAKFEASGSDVTVSRRDVEASGSDSVISSRSSESSGVEDSSDVARRSVEASGQDEAPSSRSADVEASGSESTITRRDVEASGSESMVSSRSDDGSGSDGSSDVVRRSALDSESSGEEQTFLPTRVRRHV